MNAITPVYFESNSTHILCNEDVATTVLLQTDPKEVIQSATLVCLAWNKYATNAAKIQLICNGKEELRIKMKPFLDITKKTVEDYCPFFQELFQTRKDRSIKDINTIVNNSTYKCNVSLRSCTIFTGFSVDNPRDPKRGDIVLEQKQPFASFDINIDGTTRIHGPNTERAMHGGFAVGYLKNRFPIELFELKTEFVNNELKLITEKDREGNYCICVGKAEQAQLIEFIILKDRDSTLTENIPSILGLKSSMCFIPNLDAGDPITLKHVEAKVKTGF